MQPRVTVIQVALDDQERVESTRQAVQGQTRAPERIVQVDGWDAIQSLPPAEAEEWLWLLSTDTRPAPDALERLLAAVEVAPSVAVAGPKLVDADDAGMIRSFGESVSRYGAAVHLVEDELDQAQHDRAPDVLSVAREGMLVRRPVFEALGGLDPGLPHVDAGLDLGVRARLAGHRVVRVADARVALLRRPEDARRSRPAPPRVRTRMARRAQLHRRLVWAPAAAVPIHWLSLVPLAVLRSVGRLLAKRPETIGGEFAAAFMAAFDPTVPGARTRLRRARKLGWGAIAPLRIPPDEVRRRAAAERERRAELRGHALEIRRARFVPGGFAVLLLALALSAVLNWRLLGTAAIGGGGLRPLPESLPVLWEPVLGESGGTALGWTPADPFSGLIAVLGTVTGWAPSLALVVLWLGAMPLAALAAWWCATRISERAWPPVVAAIAWMLAPPLLTALADGRPGAVIAHLVLPWLLLAALDATRSWSAAAGGALLFATAVAAAPSLAPALTAMAVLWAVLRPRAIVRLLGIPVLGLALLAPVAAVQLLRGTPLGLFADPGLPQASEAPHGWELLLGIPAHGAGAWDALLGEGALSGIAAVALPALLCAPLAALALLAVFLPGARRAIPSLVVALLGLATAVAAAHLVVGGIGAEPLGPWPGAGLSLYWLGLLGAAVSALETLRPAAVPLGAVLVGALAAAVVPAGVAVVAAAQPVVHPGSRVLPAIVEAESADRPQLGTLVLAAQPDGSLAVTVERGPGTALNAFRSLDATAARGEPSEEELRLAELAGNLASFGAVDATAEFEQRGIAFLLVPPASGSAAPGAQRLVEALDASPQLEPVGETEAGVLWRASVERTEPEPGPALGALARTVLGVQAGLLAITLLLAIPTGPRRRVAETSALPGEDPADTFAEDDDA